MSAGNAKRRERVELVSRRAARRGTALSLRKVRALRRMRAGVALDTVCREFRLAAAELRALEDSMHAVPDAILARLESILHDNEKLRRLVAGLQRSGT